MNIYFETRENYYSGFQKFNILKDRTFQGCLIVFAILLVMHFPASKGYLAGPYRDCYFISLFLVYMLPAVFILAGGMPAAGWRWYAAAALFYAAATIPVSFGASYFFLLLTLPSVFFFVKLDRTAPGLFAALGYKERAMPAKEIIFTILTSATLIGITWMAQTMVRKNGFAFLPFFKYFYFIATSTLYYGTLWGLLYGLLMRRFIDMRYENAFPVALNIILMSAYWFCSMTGYDGVTTSNMIAAATLQSLASQTTFGLNFHFTKSARPLLATYVIFYLFVKSALA